MVIHPSRQRIPSLLIRWPWLLVGVAWAIAVLATLTGQRLLIDHHFLLEESGLAWPLAAAIFLVGWQVMIAAMMAPSSIPTVMPRVKAALTAGRGGPHPQRVLAVFFVGYAGAWTAFGLLAFSGDTLIHHTVDAWPWLAAHSFLIGATTFALAGLFQFSPWKGICLARCRRPHAVFVDGHPANVAHGWRLGMRHGADSIGCCWALMLIMFGIGVGNLGWMAGLTGVMLGEAIMPSNRAGNGASRVVGIALLALAGLWLAHPAWLGAATVS